jgi:beta-phosphoglucomutase family hydrolase
MTNSATALRHENFDAILFDLDGVLTDTASVHGLAWKQLFDEFRDAWQQERGESFDPFVIEVDYKRHVDGKPRLDGVRDFLASRGITLPDGDPDDAPDAMTIWGLGKRKNELFHQQLQKRGVEAFPGAVRLLEYLRREGIRRAVVSASKNCQAILEAAELTKFFEYRMDGVKAAEMKLRGKPHPDTFLTAARSLGVEPERAAVLEDALSGVAAGEAGHFKLVVGVGGEGEAQALLDHGADRVVADLTELIPPDDADAAS